MSEFENFIKNHKGLKGKVSLTGYCPLSDMYWGSSESYEQYVAYEVWKHQQAEIDQLKAEKAGLEKLIKDWRKSANWMCATDDKHVINSLRSCADDLEKALRGANDHRD